MYTYFTDRLILKKIKIEDAKELDKLMNDDLIAANNYNIPYPYKEGYALEWIKKGMLAIESNELRRWKIECLATSQLLGIIEYRISLEHNRGDIGYWIGREYRGNKYCTEALTKVIDIGYNQFNLIRIEAFCFSDNIVSKHIIKKLGFVYEGTLRKDSKIMGEYKDTDIYSMLREEYLQRMLGRDDCV